MKSHKRVNLYFHLDGVVSSNKAMLWAVKSRDKKKFYGLATWNKEQECYVFDPDLEINLSERDALEIGKFLRDLNFVHNSMEEKERLKKGATGYTGYVHEYEGAGA